MSQYVTKIRTDKGDKQIDYNALANLPTISNPNLLINGDFQVWQRGESFPNVANKYTADRWMIKNARGNTSIVERSSSIPSTGPMCQSIHIKETIDENTYLAYNFEHSMKGTYTLSFWYLSTTQISTYSYDSGKHVKLMDLAASSDWRFAFVSFHADSMTCLDVIHAMKIGECYITGVKLEVGTTATPFSPRSHAEELALCQRYAYVWKPIDHYTLAYHIFKSSSNSINFSVQLPFVMRTSPSLSVLGGGVSCVYNDNFNETYGSTSIEMDIANNYTAKVKASFGITFRTDAPVEFFAYSSLGLLFDAEIY